MARTTDKLGALLQAAPRRGGSSFFREFRHLGALGLFFLAILDSSPLPTFGGPDILIAILSATHKDPWWENAAATATGSLIGACLTYRIAQRAGSAWLNRFGGERALAPLRLFEKRGTAVLAVSTAVPFPFPTSMFFAAAGASNYPVKRFVAIVAVCRAARYSAIAIAADLYGRSFVRVLRHPVQYWGWFLLAAAAVAGLIAAGMVVRKQFLGTGGEWSHVPGMGK